MSNNNIHPIFDRMLSREDREAMLDQRATMVWFTGFSGSGKSTLAVALERELYNRGFFCRILDGDNIRSGINRNLGFSNEDRHENIRRIAEVARLFIDSGVIIISAFVSPLEELRNMARDIVGVDDFVEVYVSTPLEECERRDCKGLYKKARAGEIPDFTGISSPFEVPENPTISIDTTNVSVDEAVERLLTILLPKIEGGKN